MRQCFQRKFKQPTEAFLPTNAVAFIFATCLVSTFVSPAKADPKSFICKSGQWQGESYSYISVAIMRSGVEKPLIPHITASGTSLENKCRIITERLNAANDAGRLRYLTYGGDPKTGLYICGTSQLGALCQDTLFKLIGSGVNGNRTISFLAQPNQDAIRQRDGRSYLNVTMLLDPMGTECGQGYELKGDLCQKKPDLPCPDGSTRSTNGECLCPSGKVKSETGICISPISINCTSGTVLSPDGRSCIPYNYPTPGPTPQTSATCPVGWGPTSTGCMPLVCPTGMVPSINGCTQGISQPIYPVQPLPYQPNNCPAGMAKFLCDLLLPRN